MPRPDEQAEEQGQLPDLPRRGWSPTSAHAGHDEAEQDDVADADPAHQPAAQRAAQAEDDEPDRRGERHRAVDQPGSSVIDRRNAPGAERTPAVTSTTTAVTATTTHP